jgi:MOSC domain-containing protein YiiM
MSVSPNPSTRADGRVRSVNVGRPRTVDWRGRPVRTAIWKTPASGRVSVRGVNLSGDEQADRAVHGGPYKALYAYSQADYAWWGRELGRPLDPGTFGENLTVEGVDPTTAVVGERWHVGGAVVQVTEPRLPCFKLGLRMGDPTFPKRFAAAGRPGTYLAVVEEGDIGADDLIAVVARPAHGLTVATVAHAYLRDRSLAWLLLEAEDVTPSWRRWAAEATTRARSRAGRPRPSTAD